MANPSAGFKQGGKSAPGQEQCEKLEENNEKARAGITRSLQRKKGRNQEEESALAKAKGSGMAISSAESTVPGASGTFTASSSGVANRLVPSGQVDGGTAAQRGGQPKRVRDSEAKKYDARKKRSGVLCGASHVHPGGGKGAHAECKIVNTMTNKAMKRGASMQGGSMLFKVDWRSSNFRQGTQSGMPCEACFAMMCHAAGECGIKIYICDEKNQPQQLTEEECKEPDGYRKLCQRIDGNPTPGRG